MKSQTGKKVPFLFCQFLAEKILISEFFVGRTAMMRVRCRGRTGRGIEKWKMVQPFSIDTSCRVVGSFRLCLFSLQAHKENRRKEMRFAAVQIPAKIGSRSLNGENLMYSTACRTYSDSSPFFTLTHRRFLHAVIYKAARDAGRFPSGDAVTVIRTPLGVQGLVGGHTMPADVRFFLKKFAIVWLILRKSCIFAALN